MATWIAPSTGAPPKSNSQCSWIPAVLAAGPGTISTVAGAFGTTSSTDPRVATVAHADVGVSVTTTYCPTSAEYELVRFDPRDNAPVRGDDRDPGAGGGRADHRQVERDAALSPPPWFLVSM